MACQMKRILAHTGACIAAVFFCGVPAAAQAPDLLTPRDRLVGFIQTGDWKAPPVQAQAEIPDKPQDPAENKTPEDVDSNTPKTDLKLTLPNKKSAKNTAKSGVPIPFYLSAMDYLKARGSESGPVIRANYMVSRESADEAVPLAPEKVSLEIGPDYIAVSKASSTRIYDFAADRILSISGGKTPHFQIESLYAQVFKQVGVVNKTTQRGKLSQLQISPDLTLDAFWLESSLGWTARNISDSVKIRQSETGLTGIFDGQTVLGMELKGPAFPSVDHLNALAAFWHHDLPIHPEILARSEPIANLPSIISVLSRSPTTPNGVKITWKLDGSEIIDADFPLPADLPNIVRTPDARPLAFVLAEAGDNSALGGRPDANSLRDRIHNSFKSENYLDAWIAAAYLSRQLGGCENDPALLCEDIKVIEKKAGSGDLLYLVASAQHVKSPDDRLGLLNAIMTEIEGKEPPAFVLKTAGVLRSKLKSDQSDSLKDVSAGALLERALIQYPYDPETYHSLSKVYAAQRRYAESWELLDSLRQMDNIPPSFTKPVAKVEASLRKAAPGYFLP